jgi:hypothetical protein
MKNDFTRCQLVKKETSWPKKDGAAKLQMLDAVIVNWVTHTVRGQKTGHARMATKLIAKMEMHAIVETTE